jgi:hypothetical protein
MTLQILIRSVIIALLFAVSVIVLIAPGLFSLDQSFSETRHLWIAGSGIILYGLDDYIFRWKSGSSNQSIPYCCGCS